MHHQVLKMNGLRKILVVYKKSTFEIYQSSKDPFVMDFIRKKTKDVETMKQSDYKQKITLDKVLSVIDRFKINYDVIYRADLTEIKNKDLVISVGGDGTLLEVSHYIRGKMPVLGVNSNPERSIGYFCCTDAENFEKCLSEIEKKPVSSLNRLELILNNKKIHEPVLNEVLVAHENPAASTRYRLEANNKTTDYKVTYGFFACTAAGSTGAMYQIGGFIMPLNSSQIQYFSRGVKNEKFGFADEIKITSLTRRGKIFIDGSHLKHGFTLLDSLLIKKGIPLNIIGDLKSKRIQSHYSK